VVALVKAGIIVKLRTSKWVEPTDDKTNGWQSVVRVKPKYEGGVLGGLEALATASVPGRAQHGGKREPKPRPICPQGCSSSAVEHAVDDRWTCTRCGEVLSEKAKTTRPNARKRRSQSGNIKVGPLVNQVDTTSTSPAYETTKFGVSSSDDGLEDDPVIMRAVALFGGTPRRVREEVAS